MGGGLAGSSLALQIKRANPNVSIKILEKAEFPLAEAAHKVGESTVEIAGRYFGDVLGLREYMKERQLPKPGLRFYFTAGNNEDVTKRIEIGFKNYPKYPTFQLDRGRLENDLYGMVKSKGVEFIDDATIRQIEISQGGDHVVSAEKDGKTITVHCRWLVDAAGRVGLLRKKFGIGEELDHPVSAAWFRLPKAIDLTEYSNDPDWLARAPVKHLRRHSTVHLMGKGYWFWLIPLSGGSAEGSTSLGLVAHNDCQPFESFNTMDKLYAWLEKNEPQTAKFIKPYLHQVMDFKTLKRYALRSSQVFSKDRWLMVGVAATFHDPFYSPGSDSISAANTYATDLIVRDKKGEDVSMLVEKYNAAYLELFDAVFGVFAGLYHFWGNPQVMTAKMHYDYWLYWGYMGLLAYHDRLCDVDFTESVHGPVEELGMVYEKMREIFIEWHEHDQRPRKFKFLDQYDPAKMTYQLHMGMGAGLSDDDLRKKVRENITLSFGAAIEIFRHAVKCCFPEHLSKVMNRPLNPFALSLHPDKWEADGLFDPSKAIEPDARVKAEVERIKYELA
jgi:flavin-dependent dehydrogenase